MALPAGIEPARLRLEGAALSTSESAREGLRDVLRSRTEPWRVCSAPRSLELHVIMSTWSDGRELHPRSWFGRPVPNCSATVAWWSHWVTLPVVLLARQNSSLLRLTPWQARTELNRVPKCWKLRCESSLGPVALPTGVEPVSPLRQRGCDTSRIRQHLHSRRAPVANRTRQLWFRKPRTASSGRSSW